MAYFDYNATTPLNQAGRDALLNGLDSAWANPSSPYRISAQAYTHLEESREVLAGILGKSSEEIIFNGGATEANNAVLKFLAESLPFDRSLCITPFEHPSVDLAARHWFRDRLNFLSVSSDGIIDLDQFDQQLTSEKVGAVSVMAVNNETGVIQPWQTIQDRCHKAGILFHCDASQWFGKQTGGSFDHCDFLIGCGHKFGGPKGIGFLALSKNSLGFQSQLGGEQESGKRGGTENVASILAMVAALESSLEVLSSMLAQEQFRNDFEEKLTKEIADLVIIGKSAGRVPNTSFLLLPKYDNIRWVRKLDKLGHQISTGSACATGHTSNSPILEALGFEADAGRRTVRVSSSPDCTKDDWLHLAFSFASAWEELKSSTQSPDTEVITI